MRNKNKIAIYNLVSTVIIQGLAFFSGPIFSNLLGTNNYGIATVYLTWVNISSTVFSLQAGSTIALARSNFSIEEQDQYQSSVLGLATSSYIGFSLLTLLFINLLHKLISVNSYMVILCLVHGWGSYCISFANQKFTYEFKAEKNLILSISISVLSIVASIVFICLFPVDTNYWGRIIGQASVYFLIGVFLFVYIFRYGRTFVNIDYWKFTLPIAIPTIFHLLANIVLNQTDKVMLQGMVSNSAAGIYGLALTFSTVLSTIWNALNNSWVPFYYEYTKTEQIDEMKKHAKNYIELFTIITLGFMLLSREVFRFYAASSFWEGEDFIVLFSLGYYFVFLYSFPVNYEFYMKRTGTIATGTILAAIINIVLNYCFIVKFGIIGAVVATITSHGLQFLFHYINARRIGKESFPFSMKDFFPGCITVLTVVLFCLLVKEYWFIRWIVAVGLGAFLVIKIYFRKEIF